MLFFGYVGKKWESRVENLSSNGVLNDNLKNPFTDIFNFLIDSWKKLAIACIVGVALAICCWYFFAPYSAEYILVNNANVSPSFRDSNSYNIGRPNNDQSALIKEPSPSVGIYALDLLSWKAIQTSLPSLAAQALGSGSLPSEQRGIFRNLAHERWWQKNIIPKYALSKADTKDLAVVGKALDAASTTILSLTISAEGGSKESAIESVHAAANFLRTGGAYLQLRSLLNAYDSDTILVAAEIQKKISAIELEMVYQERRAKNLEELRKRFPAASAVGQQLLDPTDSNAKYMPIVTQLIAVNEDINKSHESLIRLNARLTQLQLIRNFLDQAMPIAEETLDGLALEKKLLLIESAIREKMRKGDLVGEEVLDRLREQLMQISTRFTKGLEANTTPIANKGNLLKFLYVGFTSSFFLMLIFLIIKNSLVGIRITTDN